MGTRAEKKGRGKYLWAAAVFFFLLAAGDARALRCGNRLVDTGDRKVEVLQKCGNPTFAESWKEEVIVYRSRTERQIRRISSYRVEEWTYNFGSNRFIYFLRLVNGRVERIEEGPLGSSRLVPPFPQAECGQRVEIGERRVEVLRKCGRPVTVDKRKELRVSSSPGQEENVFVDRIAHVDIEEWVYNFGPTHFLLFIRMERGRVVGLESGDYGF